MTQVYYDFRHSKDVIKELAREGAETPPPNDAPARHYIDISLRILGKSHILSDGRIQREFLQQQSLIHNILEQKHQEADQHFLSTSQQIQDLGSEMHERFEVVKAEMHGRFEAVQTEMHGRFEAVQTDMYGRFKAVQTEMREAFETVHQTLKKLNDRLDRLEGDIGQAIDASHNRLRVRGWDNINPVRMIGLDGNSAGVPDCFPRTVRKFWALKLPSRFPYLVELVRCYRVRYEDWHREDRELFDDEDDSDLEDGSNTSISSVHGYPLVTAVELYPEKAHRAVAARLGLEYDEIKKFMDRAATLQRRSSGPGKKGADVSEAQADIYRKRTKFKEAPSEEVTDVTSPDRVAHQSPSSSFSAIK